MTLETYLAANGLKETDFAKLIGVEQSTVNRLKRGSMPTREVMARIFEVTGGQVTGNDFYGLSEDAAA